MHASAAPCQALLLQPARADTRSASSAQTHTPAADRRPPNVARAVYGSQISRLSVYQDRFLVGRTQCSLLLGDLEAGGLSELAWQGHGGERFYFESDKVAAGTAFWSASICFKCKHNRAPDACCAAAVHETAACSFGACSELLRHAMHVQPMRMCACATVPTRCASCSAPAS